MYNVVILRPFAEWDSIKARSADAAIAHISSTDWPDQIHPDSLHEMAAKETAQGRFRVFLLTPYAMDVVEGARDENDAYRKSAIHEFMQKGVPYAIAVNGKIVEELGWVNDNSRF